MLIFWYIAAVNAVGFCVTCADKIAAVRHRRRVSERTLFLLALAGGAAAMYLAMLLIRHKTKKRRFMLGLPAILLLHIVLWTLLPLSC